MKYIVLIGDGMADHPVAEFGGKTPLEQADIPHMDEMATMGEYGLVRTIPIGCPPGSDTGNLSIMGYNPQIIYTGRSPLEAVALGLDFTPGDIVFRCNLVTLSENESFDDREMLSHSGSGVTQEEAEAIVASLNEAFGSGEITFAPGATYRHVMVVRGKGSVDDQKIKTYPPHDNPGAKIGRILPEGPLSDMLTDLMRRSVDILKNHPVNVARREKGEGAVSSIWFWGEGRKPDLVPLSERTGLSGSVISAVPLIHGIGMLAGFKPVYVEGATADINTNYEGKAQAAVRALKEGDDIVVVHIEAPDECGHDADAKGKLRSIEYIDRRNLKIILDEMRAWGEPFRLLLMPDHETPLDTRSHSGEPIPYALYDSRVAPLDFKLRGYDENSAKKTGRVIQDGYTLIYRLIGREDLL
ncbi:MAG: cofactor-independent phosphoglycerate mutase [Christensenellales bacterium]|jgi:2,3-bisphosphoglycerate-independent phosphoglycerate mutase